VDGDALHRGLPWYESAGVEGTRLLLVTASGGTPASEASWLAGETNVVIASGMRSSPGPATLTPLQPTAKTAMAASTTDNLGTRTNKSIEGKTGNEEVRRSQFTARAVPLIVAGDRRERHNRSRGRSVGGSQV
jgi:hypothetical protein